MSSGTDFPSITTTTIDEVVRKCRAAGKSSEYDEVIGFAELTLNLIQKEKDQQGKRLLIRQRLQESSVLGYIGFALMKKEKYSEAIESLTKSKAIRENIVFNHQNLKLMGKQQALHSREAKVVDEALKECYSKLGQTPPLPSLIKYPRTTHLFDAGGTATNVDDLILPGLDMIVPVFCNGRNQVIIEEKIDGSNLGISLCPYSGHILVQNRSHYISRGDHAQYNRIPEWIEQHRQVLTTDILKGGNRILYGEWVTARHSIPYKKLPAYFIAFDIYDKKTQSFMSRTRFHSIMKNSGIPVVPIVQVRTFGPYGANMEACKHEFRQELIRLLDAPSTFRSDEGAVEGIVLRVDDSSSMWLKRKFKVVRPDFVGGCSNGHWATRQVEKQMVDFEHAATYIKSCYPFATRDDSHGSDTAT